MSGFEASGVDRGGQSLGEARASLAESATLPLPGTTDRFLVKSDLGYDAGGFLCWDLLSNGASPVVGRGAVEASVASNESGGTTLAVVVGDVWTSDDASSAVEAIARLGRRVGVEELAVRTTNPAVRVALARAGFVPALDKHEGVGLGEYLLSRIPEAVQLQLDRLAPDTAALSALDETVPWRSLAQGLVVVLGDADLSLATRSLRIDDESTRRARSISKPDGDGLFAAERRALVSALSSLDPADLADLAIEVDWRSRGGRPDDARQLQVVVGEELVSTIEATWSRPTEVPVAEARPVNRFASAHHDHETARLVRVGDSPLGPTRLLADRLDAVILPTVAAVRLDDSTNSPQPQLDRLMRPDGRILVVQRAADLVVDRVAESLDVLDALCGTWPWVELKAVGYEHIKGVNAGMAGNRTIVITDRYVREGQWAEIEQIRAKQWGTGVRPDTNVTALAQTTTHEFFHLWGASLLAKAPTLWHTLDRGLARILAGVDAPLQELFETGRPHAGIALRTRPDEPRWSIEGGDGGIGPRRIAFVQRVGGEFGMYAMTNAEECRTEALVQAWLSPKPMSDAAQLVRSVLDRTIGHLP